MLEWIADPQAWIALATLIGLEVVLGIDNIIFISILVGRLPEDRRNTARRIGLALAMISRLLLLFSLTWVMKLTAPLFTVLAQEISGRDLILIGGGLFLLWKSAHEIHNSLEGPEGDEANAAGAAAATFGSVLVQIMLIDVIFSLDSVITAVGMVDEVEIMVIAVVVSVAIMMFAARPIGEFVDRHPTIKMLALSFLVLVGLVLIAEGFDRHIPKGYVYFAMAFSMAVEMLNLRSRKKHAEAIRLRRSR